MARDYGGTLWIENPSAYCGTCGFVTRLTGKWSVEDGRLMFRADADPQPRRGPDLHSCSEGRSCPDEFACITVDGENLGGEEIAALRASAEYARLHEFDEPGAGVASSGSSG